MIAGRKNIGVTVIKWLQEQTLHKKLITPAGITFLVLLALGCGYMAAEGFILLPFIIAGSLIGIMVIYYCLFRPLSAFYWVTTLAFLAFYPGRLLDKELGLSTGVEVLILFVFIGAFIYRKRADTPKGSLFKTSVSVALFIYTLYLLIEMFNPNINALNGWAFTFKRYLAYICTYILAYVLIDTPDKFRYFLRFWIVFSFAAGLYGCYQQWFGYLPLEMRYIERNPLEMKLLFQGGTFRKFSFLSDVVSFGVLAGSMAVMTLLLAINEKRKKRAYTLYFFTIILVLGMLYSGTRTTYIMLPAGIAIYSLMTIQNKNTVIILFISFMVAFLILFLPIDNGVLNRIRSTFDSKDASLNVRDINRHYIQPYIYRHPFGGGVATSGVDGMRFYPHHILAGFPPDSGFLKVSLEQGWLGLALTIFYNIVMLCQGIYYYFRMKNNEYKLYMVVIVATLFSIIVTQYAQVSVGQLPQALFIFSSVSLMKRLLEFDEQSAEQRSSESEAALLLNT